MNDLDLLTLCTSTCESSGPLSPPSSSTTTPTTTENLGQNNNESSNPRENDSLVDNDKSNRSSSDETIQSSVTPKLTMGSVFSSSPSSSKSNKSTRLDDGIKTVSSPSSTNNDSNEIERNILDSSTKISNGTVNNSYETTNGCITNGISDEKKCESNEMKLPADEMKISFIDDEIESTPTNEIQNDCQTDEFILQKYNQTNQPMSTNDIKKCIIDDVDLTGQTKHCIESPVHLNIECNIDTNSNLNVNSNDTKFNEIISNDLNSTECITATAVDMTNCHDERPSIVNVRTKRATDSMNCDEIKMNQRKQSKQLECSSNKQSVDNNNNHPTDETKPNATMNVDKKCEKKLVLDESRTKAMDSEWHEKHFSCWQCDDNLTAKKYVLRDDKSYCIKCFEANFSSTCDACRKIIGIDSKVS